MYQHTTIAHFSPGGTTQNIAQAFGAQITPHATYLDLLREPPLETITFTAKSLGGPRLPVPAGRIPSVCTSLLEKIRGTNTPAVIIAVYGNRAFDDALLEMADLLQTAGFHIIGAGAFIAKHSIFERVGAQRPNEDDFAILRTFAQNCMEKLETLEENRPELAIPGNRPYCKASNLPMRPTGKKSTCTNCGACAKICPTKAIDPAAPTKTEKAKCMTCMACVYACPTGSRALHTPLYKLARGPFEKLCAQPCQPFVVF